MSNSRGVVCSFKSYETCKIASLSVQGIITINTNRFSTKREINYRPKQMCYVQSIG